MARGQTTPGRRANHPAQHIPFNDRPKEVGTRTGAAMPTNVPRNSMGFEDVSAFFKSPAMTEAPSSINTIRTGASMFSGLRSGRRGLSTPAAIAETPAPRGRGGRMSQLALGSDEEDGSALGDGLLNEDDGVLDPSLSSPGPWYSTNAPPTVTIPSRSRLPPPSPAVDYDNLPTPQKSARRAGVRSSPRRARTEASEVDMLGMDVEDNAYDEASVSQAIVPSSPASPQVRQSPRTISAARRSAATSAGGDEVLRERESRLSYARGKSRDRALDGDDDQDDAGAGPSFSYNADTTGVDMDQSFDTGPGDYDTGADFGGADGGYDDVSVHYGDDVSMEEEAVARTERSHDEEEDRVPLKPKKARQPTFKKPHKPAKRTERAPSEKARLAEKKRTRVSRIGVDDDDEEVKYLGDFTTRSGRKHFKPLEYWRGEKFNYGRGPGLSVIKEVVHLEEEVKKPLGAKKTTSGRGRSHSARPGNSAPPEEEGWDDETEPIGLVTEFSTGRDIQRRIAFPRNRLEPKQVAGSDFKYQKVFGEDQFIASGVVYIPVGGSKPAKPSKDNSYVFFVIQGGVQVTVHKTSFVMATGGMFMVPRGNEYEIENISQTNEAQLFFAQARKIRANESDEAALEALQDRVRSVSAALRESVARGDSDEE